MLAATCRIFDHLGSRELIYNYLSLSVRGEAQHFLVNPFGCVQWKVRSYRIRDGPASALNDRMCAK